MKRNRDELNKDAIRNHIWRPAEERHRLVALATPAEREAVVTRTALRVVPLLLAVMAALLSLVAATESGLNAPAQAALQINNSCATTSADGRPRSCETARAGERRVSASAQ